MNEVEHDPIFSKRNLLIFLSVVSLYAGYYLGNKSLVIFGLLLLSLLLLALFYSASLFRLIKVKRQHYPRTFEGQELYIELLLDTESPQTHYMLEVVDTVPPSDPYRVGHLVPYGFNRAHKFSILYKTKCVRRRGLYFLGPVHLYCADPLGIYPRELKFDEYTRLLVYPRGEELKEFSVLGQGTLPKVGVETVRRPGQSEEFEGVREYRLGDSLSRIHWLSSARHNRLIVKEFQEDMVTEVSIFLDLFRLSHTGLGDITSTEYIIKAGAAIARAAIEKSHLVQLFALGKKLDQIPLGGGREHLLAILDRMVFYKPSGEGSFEEQFVEQIRFLHPGSTVVLLISATNFSFARIQPALHHLHWQNIKIIAVIIDDRSFLKLWREQEIKHRAAPPLVELERLFKFCGCQVYTIRSKDNIAQKLVNVI